MKRSVLIKGFSYPDASVLGQKRFRHMSFQSQNVGFCFCDSDSLSDLTVIIMLSVENDTD